MIKRIVFTLIFLLSTVLSYASLHHRFQLSAGLESNINFPTRIPFGGIYGLSIDSGLGLQAGFQIKPGAFQVSEYHLLLHSPRFIQDLFQFHLGTMNVRYHALGRGDNYVLAFATFEYKFFETAVGMNASFLNMDPDRQSLVFYYPTSDLPLIHWMFRMAFTYDWKTIPLKSSVHLRNFGDHYMGTSFVISYHLVHTYALDQRNTLILDAGLHPSGTLGLNTLYNKFTLDLKWESVL